MRKRKIMIVEDDALTARFIQMALSMQGYEVCELLSTGEEALRNVTRDKPDLLIMDILLCDNMDGMEAAKKIRKRLDIPILFLTGYQVDELSESVKNIKSSKILMKPVDTNDILRAVEHLFIHRF